MTEDVQAPARIRRGPAERAALALLPACVGAWTAAEIMHAAHMPWVDIGMGSAVLAGLAGIRGARSTATGIMLAGAWTALAARVGPLADPGLYYPLTWTWAALTFSALRWASRHPAVVAARDRRTARADWLDRRNRWGLPRTHLLDWEPTRLGEWYLVDVSGSGKRASSFASSDVAERIAEDLILAPSRVRVRRHRIGPRIEISVRRADPWADPILHPALTGDPELDLSGPYSIRQPAVIGQDPETGHPLTLPLWDERGGKNITVVGQKGAGKTVLLNDISERVTAAGDALMIRVNLSIKGLAEARRWGPACHLTAFGSQQQARALKVLRVISRIIEWRSRQEYGTDVFVPSPGDPEIVLIMDEIDSAAAVPAIRQELEDIASKGREYGVTLVRSGQRGTAAWTGGGNVRANDDVFCIGMVNRASEAMHAAGDLGLQMPDMASYGEGHGGVWAIAETGGEQDAGRTFMLKDPPDIARIVAERASRQPDLKPELKAFLGKSYEELLSTDVYAQWARSQHASPAVAHPRPDMPAPDGPAPDGAPVAVLADPLTVYDREAEEHMASLGDDDLRARWRKQGERNADTRRLIEETAAMPQPDVTPEEQAAYTRAMWDAEAEQTQIPPDIRARLLELVAGEGISARQAVNALGVPEASRAKVTWWLNRLRWEGKVSLEGKGRGARWKLVPQPEGGDGS